MTTPPNIVWECVCVCSEQNVLHCDKLRPLTKVWGKQPPDGYKLVQRVSRSLHKQQWVLMYLQSSPCSSSNFWIIVRRGWWTNSNSSNTEQQEQRHSLPSDDVYESWWCTDNSNNISPRLLLVYKLHYNPFFFCCQNDLFIPHTHMRSNLLRRTLHHVDQRSRKPKHQFCN